MKMERYWINAPSTFQPEHRLHGCNVLAGPEEYPGTTRVYFIEGDVISCQVTTRFLSKGWVNKVTASPSNFGEQNKTASNFPSENSSPAVTPMTAVAAPISASEPIWGIGALERLQREKAEREAPVAPTPKEVPADDPLLCRFCRYPSYDHDPERLRCPVFDRGVRTGWHERTRYQALDERPKQ